MNNIFKSTKADIMSLGIWIVQKTIKISTMGVAICLALVIAVDALFELGYYAKLAES